MTRDYKIIFLCSLLYIIFIYFLNYGLTFRLDSDYDMLLSYYSFVVEYVRTYWWLPRIHPYAGLGLPLAGDPGISFYNPLFLTPVVLLGMIPGLWVVMWLMVFIAGLAMSKFLSSLNLSRMIILWGSLLYMVSGALAARFAAGHIIFFLTYPFWPLIFLYLIRPAPRSLGVVGAYFFLSGDIYAVWFTAIFFIITQGYKRNNIIKNSFLSLCSFLLLASPKLYFVIVDALPVFQRTFAGNPAEGSIHVWWTLLPFLVPLKVAFYDRPFFQRHLGFYFNWYEYYAFISPLPFIFFYKNTKKLITHHPQLITIVIIGLLYVSLAFPYSPFYWLFHFIPQLHIFRVPQRMYLPLSSVVITLCCLAAQPWKKSLLLYTILISSLVMTGMTSLHAFTYAFEKPRIHEKALVTWLKNYDSGKYFVLDMVCCNQIFLVEAHIPVLNFYSGWIPNYTPDYKDLSKTRATYILANTSDDFSQYTYQKIYQAEGGSVWKTDSPTVVPK